MGFSFKKPGMKGLLSLLGSSVFAGLFFIHAAYALYNVDDRFSKDIDVGDMASAVAVDPLHHHLIVAEGVLRLYNIEDGKEILQKNYSVGLNWVQSIAYDSKGNRIFALDSESGKIFVYDGNSLNLLKKNDEESWGRTKDATAVYVDEKNGRLIVDSPQETEFLDLQSLHYISSLHYDVPPEFDPYGPKSEMYPLAFDGKARRLYFAKSLNAKLNLKKDYWVGYEACLVAYDIDTGKLAETVGKCKAPHIKNLNPASSFSFINSAVINQANRKMVIGELIQTPASPPSLNPRTHTPERALRLHLRLLDLDTMKDTALLLDSDFKTVGGRPVDMASDSDSVFVLFQHQAYANVSVVSFK
jgi:hypothetical protein